MKGNKYLYVDTSTLENAGKGLFTKKFIHRGSIIGYFNGELIDEEQAAARDIGDRGHYFIELSSGKILDTFFSKSLARWANDSRNQKKNNAVIHSTKSGIRAYISSTKDILPNSEIFVDYGLQYWEALEVR